MLSVLFTIVNKVLLGGFNNLQEILRKCEHTLADKFVWTKEMSPSVSSGDIDPSGQATDNNHRGQFKSYHLIRIY